MIKAKVLKKLNVILCCFLMMTSNLLVAKNTWSSPVTTIDDLIQSQQLRVNIKLKTKQPIIAHQAVVIEIEFATNRWFEGANIIENIRLDNVVALPQQDSGFNGTTTINGEIWASQVKELIIFPMITGKYQIPPLQVNMSINTPNGKVSGTTTTSALNFEAIMPESLSIYNDYWVSNNFQIETQLDSQEDVNAETGSDSEDKKEFEIGQAVTQTVIFTIDGVPAMMLPEIETPQISGISIYKKPSQVMDSSNRGELIGTRIEQFTYIFEQPGQYTTKEQTFIWWDNTTNSISELVIPANQWQVTAPLSYHLKNLFTSSQNWLSMKSIGFILLALSTLWFAAVIYNKRGVIWAFYKQFSNYQFRQSSKTFKKFIEQQNYLQASFYLYFLLNIKTPNLITLQSTFALNPAANKLIDDLLQLGFANHNKNCSVTFDLKKAKTLLKYIAKVNKEQSNTIKSINNLPNLNPRQ